MNNVESVAFVSTRQGLPTQSTAPGIALQTRPADHRLNLTGAGEPWRFEIRDNWQNVSDKTPSIAKRPPAETCGLAENGGTLPHACRQDRRTWGEMGGVHEIFRAHPLGIAETQSLPEAHGAPVGLAHPLNPAPGRLNGRAELRSPRYSRSGQLARFRQWILLRPRQ